MPLLLPRHVSADTCYLSHKVMPLGHLLTPRGPNSNFKSPFPKAISSATHGTLLAISNVSMAKMNPSPLLGLIIVSMAVSMTASLTGSNAIAGNRLTATDQLQRIAKPVRVGSCWKVGETLTCDDQPKTIARFAHENAAGKALSAKSTKKVLVLVDPALLNDDSHWYYFEKFVCQLQDRDDCSDLKKQLRTQIDQYVTDLSNEGIQAYRLDVVASDPAYKDPQALRNLIHAYYNAYSIEGVVLIGKFPYTVVVESFCKKVTASSGRTRCVKLGDPMIYYTDTILGDMDGNWDKVFHSGSTDFMSGYQKVSLSNYYEVNDAEKFGKELAEQDPYFASPEIWVSRIDAERAIGGSSFSQKTGAIADETFVTVYLEKGVAYRLFVSNAENMASQALTEEQLPLIQSLHDAETNVQVGTLPHFGTSVLTVVNKSGPYQVMLDVSEARGRFVKFGSVQKKPSLKIQKITPKNMNLDTIVPDQIIPITTKVNVSAPSSPSKELTLYSRYFTRNHAFRTGKWNPISNMIRFFDGEFFDLHPDQLETIASAGVTQMPTAASFNQDVFLSQLFGLKGYDKAGIPVFGKTYKYGSLMIHSWEGGHAFHDKPEGSENQTVSMSTLIQLSEENTPANILFFINHGCINSNIDPFFGYPDTGSVYLFRFGGLVHFGLASLGGNGFYQKVPETFSKGGDAGTGYLNSVRMQEAFITESIKKNGDNDQLFKKRSYFTVLLGDGTLLSDYGSK